MAAPEQPAPGAGNDMTSAASLGQRLQRLERAVAALRQELHGRPGATAALPVGSFDIVRFTVDRDQYGVPIQDVREVIRMVRITRISAAPRAIAGIINVRGRMVPIMDIRARLGLEEVEPGLSTPVILIATAEYAVGLIVDRVDDVIAVEPCTGESLKGALAGAGALAGVARHGDSLIQIIDTGLLLTRAELDELTAQITEHAEHHAES